MPGETEKKFVEALKRHDWTYSYSEDKAVYRRGEASQNALFSMFRSAVAEIGEDRAVELWNIHAPAGFKQVTSAQRDTERNYYKAVQKLKGVLHCRIGISNGHATFEPDGFNPRRIILAIDASSQAEIDTVNDLVGSSYQFGRYEYFGTISRDDGQEIGFYSSPIELEDGEESSKAAKAAEAFAEVMSGGGAAVSESVLSIGKFILAAQVIEGVEDYVICMIWAIQDPATWVTAADFQ